MPTKFGLRVNLGSGNKAAVAAARKLSFIGFQTLVSCKPPKPGIREGQHAFNLLVEKRADLANRLRGNAIADPFYDDSNLPAFWRAVERLW